MNLMGLIFRYPGPSLREVDFVGGHAGASSENPNPEKNLTRRALNAFDRASESPWVSKKDGIPAYIWYDFGPQVHLFPAKVSFRPRQDKDLEKAKKHMPRSFEFIGSDHDVCRAKDHWTSLCKVNNDAKITSLNETRGCEIDQSERTSAKFRCLGVKISKAGGDDGNVYASLSHIKIWVRDF